MGLVLCSRHGESGVIGNISIDLCKAIGENELLLNKKIFRIVVQVFDLDDFLYEDSVYVSEVIFNENNLNKTYKIRTESDEEKLKLLLPKTSGSCSKCFEEFIDKNNINLVT